MRIEWSDKRGPRGRYPWLLFVDRNGTVHWFRGYSIPGIAAVVGHDYEKAGIWSGSTYRLEVAPGVRAIAGRDGWETGSFREGLARAAGRAHCDRWVDVADALGVTISEAQAFLRDFAPSEAVELDQVEADLETVDGAAGPDGAEIVAVSFGGPTNRQIDAGYWASPVVVRDATGREVARVYPDPEVGWDRPVPEGQVRVLASERSRGYHGGYVSLRLAVPAGCSARLETGEVRL